MNKNLTTVKSFINTLEKGDLFFFDGSDHPMIVESRKSAPGMTAVTYRVSGTREVYAFSRPGLTTVNRVSS